MQLVEIVDFIAARTGLTKGRDLILGYSDGLEVGDHTVIVQSGGSANPDSPRRSEIMIQALTRFLSYADGMEAAEALKFALHSYAGGETTGLLLDTIVAVSPPQYIGKDDRGRHVFSTNFLVKIKEKV